MCWVFPWQKSLDGQVKNIKSKVEEFTRLNRVEKKNTLLPNKGVDTWAIQMIPENCSLHFSNHAEDFCPILV